MSRNILSTSNQTEILSSLLLMKERIIGEIMTSMNSAGYKPSSDDQLDLVRRELDQKFNYTLTLMYNKLADQMEAARATETELSKIKAVIGEMDLRYAALIEKIDQINRQQQQTDSKQQQSSHIESLFSADEHVSFRTLEEYVHRTFQVSPTSTVMVFHIDNILRKLWIV